MEPQAEVVEEQEQPAPPEPVQPEPPAPPPEPQPAAAMAGIVRACSFCGARVSLADLDQVAPMMFQCKDTDACMQRAAMSGLYPQDERALEQDLASFESRQGALR